MCCYDNDGLMLPWLRQPSSPPHNPPLNSSFFSRIKGIKGEGSHETGGRDPAVDWLTGSWQFESFEVRCRALKIK